LSSYAFLFGAGLFCEITNSKAVDADSCVEGAVGLVFLVALLGAAIGTALIWQYLNRKLDK
jgi:hypothetical protein